MAIIRFQKREPAALLAIIRNRQPPCLKIAKVGERGRAAAMLMAEKEKRQKKEAADPAESLAGWVRKVGGVLYAAAMARDFPELWVHTGGLADVPIQSTPELV